jgi:hypothetical protein
MVSSARNRGSVNCEKPVRTCIFACGRLLASGAAYDVKTALGPMCTNTACTDICRCPKPALEDVWSTGKLPLTTPDNRNCCLTRRLKRLDRGPPSEPLNMYHGAPAVYHLYTSETTLRRRPHLMFIYPHAALLHLCTTGFHLSVLH